jgi:hypothetical protein
MGRPARYERIALQQFGRPGLELHSAFMTFQLLMRVVNSMAVLTTNVYYTRRLARPLWAVVGPIHRRMIPYLLGGAASFPRPAPG